MGFTRIFFVLKNGFYKAPIFCLCAYSGHADGQILQIYARITIARVMPQ